MLAVHLAVIGHVGDDGVVGQAVGVESVEDGANAGIAEFNEAVVGSAGFAYLLLWNVFGGEVAAQALALGVETVKMAVRDVGKVGLFGVVVLVELFAGDEREVGGEDGGAEDPGLFVTGGLGEVGGGSADDFVVLVHVLMVAGSGLFEEALAHIAKLAGAPVGKVGAATAHAVDVGDDAAGEAMHLVRADEVHLAGEAGFVAGVVHAVGPGGLVGSERHAVVPDFDAMEVFAGHEGRPGGNAERGVAVGVLEDGG